MHLVGKNLNKGLYICYKHFFGFLPCLLAHFNCGCRCIQRGWHCAWRDFFAQGTVPVQGSLQTALSPGRAGDSFDGREPIQQPASAAVHLGVLLAVCPALHQTSTAGSCSGKLSCASCLLTESSVHIRCSLLNTHCSILTAQYSLHSIFTALNNQAWCLMLDAWCSVLMLNGQCLLLTALHMLTACFATLSIYRQVFCLFCFHGMPCTACICTSEHYLSSVHISLPATLPCI